MAFTDILTYIFLGIASIGIFVGGLGYVAGKFKKGSKEEKEDVVKSADTLTKFWQDQAEGYKTMMAEKDRVNDEKFTALHKELGVIQGQLAEKEKQNKEYLDILKDKNPETTQFMQFMVQAVKDQTESHKKIVDILMTTSTRCEEIHAMALVEHERDYQVTATLTKTP